MILARADSGSVQSREPNEESLREPPLGPSTERAAPSAGSPGLGIAGTRSTWDWIRLSLCVGWLLVLLAVPVVGERTASWDDVRGLVKSGQVDSVRVSKELPASASGFSTVEVHWRRGLLRYETEVIQVRGDGEDPADADVPSDSGRVVVRTPPSDQLAGLRAGLVVTRDQRNGHGSDLLDWKMPNVLGVPAAALALAALGLLVAGPQPWRATRWAWFWLLLPPVGSIAFLLLSGPTPFVPGPRRPSRRLTGGRAFLLSLLLTAVLGDSLW